MEAMRAVWFLALGMFALGLVLVVVSRLGREPVNASGFVPGVAAGFILIALAGLTGVAMDAVDRGHYWRLTLLAALGLWLAASTYLVVWGLGPGSLRDVPMDDVVAVFLILGLIATATWAGALAFVLPLVFVLTWLAGWISGFRRRGADAAARRQRPRH
jgi:hypothetical protein